MENKIIELEDLIGSKLGLYDNQTTNKDSITAEKVIDVTSICPKSEQVVIKYAQVQRGMIAQICDWYTKGEDLGVCVHYHINEMTPESLASDIVFAGQSNNMGVSAIELAKTIFDYSPSYVKA